jgi:hypothetical protein
MIEERKVGAKYKENESDRKGNCRRI